MPYLKSEGWLEALATASASCTAPEPPLAQWLQMTASEAPASSASFLINPSSASVSELMRKIG